MATTTPSTIAARGAGGGHQAAGREARGALATTADVPSVVCDQFGKIRYTPYDMAVNVRAGVRGPAPRLTTMERPEYKRGWFVRTTRRTLL